MNATVAVAAITAGSTLIAAGLTGYITLLLHKRQTSSERTKAREESRRAAYADLLTASTAAWMAVDKLWELPPPRTTADDPHPELTEALQSLRELEHALNTAMLHGPIAIAESAADLYFAPQKEYATILQLFIRHAGATSVAADLEPGVQPDSVARMRVRGRFVGDAMRVTGAWGVD